MYQKLVRYLQTLGFPDFPQNISFIFSENFIEFTNDQQRVTGNIDLFDFSITYEEFYYGKVASRIPLLSAETQNAVICFTARNQVSIYDNKNTLLCTVIKAKEQFNIDNVKKESAKKLEKPASLVKKIKSSIYNWLENNYDISRKVFKDMLEMEKLFEKRHCESTIVDIFLHLCPEIEKDYLPSRTPEEYLYVYDDKTKRWKKALDGDLRLLIKNSFEKIDPLHELTPRLPYSSAGQKSLIASIYTVLSDKKIETTNLFNANRNIFAMSNCLIDLNKPPYAVRFIKREDYIIQTTNWCYSKKETINYKEDLHKFLNSLFPDAREKSIFLRWVSFILSGEIRHKTFLVLADTRGGYNGKSTLFAFLENFFGFYCSSNPEFLNKPSIVPTRDSHNGGLRLMEKKTLLLLDDLHEETLLSCKQLKELSGGHVRKSGRCTNSSEGFEFQWLASIIMSFNGNCSPCFDGKDKALRARMVVLPMKTKFVESNADASKNKVLYDPHINEKFTLWNSSFLDLLVENFESNDYVTEKEFTQDMILIKNEILDGTLKYRMWLESCVFQASHIEEEYITLNDLFQHYRDEKSLMSNNKAHLFKSFAKLWFKSNNVEVLDKHYYVEEENGKRRKFHRGVVKGYKLKDSDSSLKLKGSRMQIET